MLALKIVKWLKAYAKKAEASLIKKATRNLEVCSERTDDEFEIAAKRLELAEEIYLKMQVRAGEKLASKLESINCSRKVAADKLELIEKELKE